MKTMKLKISELVEDFDLYPRPQVDGVHVTHIMEAIESEAPLPHILIDAKSKRIVDGLHRKRGYERLFGPDYEITVSAKEYKNDAELFLDAMRLNSSHGRNMTSYDRTYAIEKALRFHIEPELIAGALNMKVEKVTEFKQERCAKIRGSQTVVPLKLPVRHMTNKILSKEQAEIMPKLGGNQQMFYVNQLLMLIDTKLLDTENESLMERLELLSNKLVKLVGSTWSESESLDKVKMAMKD